MNWPSPNLPLVAYNKTVQATLSTTYICSKVQQKYCRHLFRGVLGKHNCAVTQPSSQRGHDGVIRINQHSLDWVNRHKLTSSECYIPRNTPDAHDIIITYSTRGTGDSLRCNTTRSFPAERADNRPIHDVKYKESEHHFSGAAVSRLYITAVRRTRRKDRRSACASASGEGMQRKDQAKHLN